MKANIFFCQIFSNTHCLILYVWRIPTLHFSHKFHFRFLQKRSIGRSWGTFGTFLSLGINWIFISHLCINNVGSVMIQNFFLIFAFVPIFVFLNIWELIFALQIWFYSPLVTYFLPILNFCPKFLNGIPSLPWLVSMDVKNRTHYLHYYITKLLVIMFQYMVTAVVLTD